MIIIVSFKVRSSTGKELTECLNDVWSIYFLDKMYVKTFQNQNKVKFLILRHTFVVSFDSVARLYPSLNSSDS